MKTPAYLVFYTTRWAGQEFYWTGDILPSGKPQISSDSALARAFTSAREAYEAAAGCSAMARWRVGRRVVRTAAVAA